MAYGARYIPRRRLEGHSREVQIIISINNGFLNKERSNTLAKAPISLEQPDGSSELASDTVLFALEAACISEIGRMSVLAYKDVWDLGKVLMTLDVTLLMLDVVRVLGRVKGSNS